MSLPPACKQDRKESQMSRLSYNLYHEALLLHACNMPRLCHCEFPYWESSSDWIIWVDFSWNTSAEWDLPLSSPCCQQSSGAENMVDGKSTSVYTYSFSCWHPAVWEKMTGAAGWRCGPDVVLGNQSLWKDCWGNVGARFWKQNTTKACVQRGAKLRLHRQPEGFFFPRFFKMLYFASLNICFFHAWFYGTWNKWDYMKSSVTFCVSQRAILKWEARKCLSNACVCCWCKQMFSMWNLDRNTSLAKPSLAFCCCF